MATLFACGLVSTIGPHYGYNNSSLGALERAFHVWPRDLGLLWMHSTTPGREVAGNWVAGACQR
jgi:hypothetical protein